MCLLGATYLFEDNRRGWVKAARVFVVKGGRGVPCRGAGKCGHLIKDQPRQRAWPRWKGASLARRSLSGQMGRRATQRDLRERGGLCRTFCLCSAAPPPDHLPWPAHSEHSNLCIPLKRCFQAAVPGKRSRD